MESNGSNTVRCPDPPSSPDLAEAEPVLRFSDSEESTLDRSSDMGSYRMCLCFTRKFGWREAEPPPDVREAFSTFTAGGAQMSADQLRGFLVESQGEAGVTIADAERIVDQVRHSRHPITNKLSRPVLSVEDFHYYLFSGELNPPIRSQIHHDMSAPLSHYFIYTGHNSYLTGNQLSSDCSDVPLIKALQRGVRVIELDLWPNSAKDNVNVLHGGTLTSAVELIKCLRSIKEHAFSASPYPVIITFEDHLTSDLQSKVAEMVTQTFGDMLFIPESEAQEELPSPESLKNRFLISTKPPVKHSKVSGDKVNVSQGEPGWSDNKNLDNEVLGDKPDSCEKKKNGGSYCDEESEEDDDSDDDSKLSQNAAIEYRHLIAIPAGKPKGGLEKALMVDPTKVRRLSLSELQLAKAAESHGTDIVRFTQRNILRIYPKGSRIDSSNYKPFTAWMHGAQMVAFNMQGYGKPLWLMHGFYRANGGCGFLKKPEFLMNAGLQVHDPKTPLPVKKRLKVKVYMGEGWHLDFSKTHFDNFSPPDFYVRVEIYGVPADKMKEKTKTIEDNWTPVWNEEFTFPLTVPELALLRIEVGEHDTTEKDDFGGQTCLPVEELRPGTRAVQLFNRKGMKLKSVRLLMRFEFC